MKKLISLLFLMVCIWSYSQNALERVRIATGVNVDAIKGPTWGYFWGTASDTLNASDTLTKIIRIIGDGYMSGEFALNCVKTSGMVTNKFIFSKSIAYPYKWEKVDSIVNTGISSGTLTAKLLANWNAPFMKIEGISGATAQRAVYEMFFIMRY
jgi:hypothetical protein